ncbi:MAG: hypothetical protein N2035_05180 [Chthoniobacterales bacterium]|nr:hypothetical protein [Chthoniobacterales bacterium]
MIRCASGICRSTVYFQFFLLIVIFIFAFLFASYGQLQVTISLPRLLYIRYEPILVTVAITNLSGQSLLLQDTANIPWFQLQVENSSGLPVPHRVTGIGLDPTPIKPSETIRRTINITPLFRLDDFGSYSIRATVFDPALNRFFSSGSLKFEITEGRVLWQELVGHPSDGTQRQLTLLSHRLPNSTALYLRILDPEKKRLYCTYRLGPLVTYGKPEIVLDNANRPHILQMNAPRSYLYSHIGLNGEIIKREIYIQTDRSKPTIERTPNGDVKVVGGAIMSPETLAAWENLTANQTRASERPVQLPPIAPENLEENPRKKFFLWPFGKKES